MEIISTVKRRPVFGLFGLFFVLMVACILYSFLLSDQSPRMAEGQFHLPEPIPVHSSSYPRAMTSSTVEIKTASVLKEHSSATKSTLRSSLAATSQTGSTLTSVLPPRGSCRHASSSPKLILLWTSFFDSWEYLPRGPFSHCSTCTDCLVTTDRSRLLASDAVIFHARDMNFVDLPPQRLPHQRWVFYCLESPPYSDFQGLRFTHSMFNWTMTYRSDSDIVVPYGYIVKSVSRKLQNRISFAQAWRKKTKSVVWMSSNCNARGGRDNYVNELKKYIDVDVYGFCGTLACAKGATEECFQNFAKTYKFFLAFENTNCKDYITEKFFRTLKYNLVPVVLGGAEYKKFVPPGSYIDALSFKSPKHLAYFLEGVGKDFSLYRSYFEWKQNYTVQISNQKECTLCDLLHSRAIQPSVHKDLRKWWVDEANCWTWENEM